MIELDLEGKHRDRAYALLASLITQRPFPCHRPHGESALALPHAGSL
jgi:hypothetical protein